MKNNSIQALRGLLFIGVFLAHSGANFDYAGLSVSSFFLLSGYLLTLKNKDKDCNINICDSIQSSFKRMSKNYLLHIITMILCIILTILSFIKNGFTSQIFKRFIAEILCNVLLIQSFVPDIDFSFSLNGASWFLSAMLFMYICFPFILNLVKRIKKSEAKKLIFIIIMFELVVSCFLSKNMMNPDIYRWLTHTFPPFRLGDFVVGMLIAIIYQDYPRKSCVSFAGCLEELIILILISMIIVLPSLFSKNNLDFIDNPTTKNLIASILLFHLIFKNNGLLTKFLVSSRFLVINGNLSNYSYLIHYVVTMYTFSACKFFGVDISVGLLKLVSILTMYILTMLISYFYSVFQKIHVSSKKSGCKYFKK